MPKRSSIGKRRSKTLPAFGFAGMSLSMASGACASTSEASANPSSPSQKHEIFLGEEEISDVSLAAFHVFDKENAGPPPLFQKPRLAAGCGAAMPVASAVPTGRNLRSLQRQPGRHPHRKKKPPHHTTAFGTPDLSKAHTVLESFTVKIELMSACGTSRKLAQCSDMSSGRRGSYGRGEVNRFDNTIV